MSYYPDPGYRDQADADRRTGHCEDCGTYIANLIHGDGGRCPICNPPAGTPEDDIDPDDDDERDDRSSPEEGRGRRVWAR